MQCSSCPISCCMRPKCQTVTPTLQQTSEWDQNKVLLARSLVPKETHRKGDREIIGTCFACSWLLVIEAVLYLNTRGAICGHQGYCLYSLAGTKTTVIMASGFFCAISHEQPCWLSRVARHSQTTSKELRSVSASSDGVTSLPGGKPPRNDVMLLK